jgi:hypothetical protein
MWARPIGFLTEVNNHQAEDRSTVLKVSSSIANETFSWLDLDAIESSISSTTLKGFGCQPDG